MFVVYYSTLNLEHLSTVLRLIYLQGGRRKATLKVSIPSMHFTISSYE